MGRWDDERRGAAPGGWRGDEDERAERDRYGRRASDQEPVRDTGRGGEYERRREPSEAWRAHASPRHEERGERWRGGDYTTYGLSGYRDDVSRAAHEDFVREQGHGVHRDERRGRGPKGFRRSDERIYEEVCERIARSGIDAEDVEVRVQDGEVTLSGEVDSRAEKRLIEDLADEAYGVQDVHNLLHLRRRASAYDTARPGADEHRHEDTHTDPSPRH